MVGSVIAFGFIVWLFHPRRPAIMPCVFALHWTAFFLLLMTLERVLLPDWDGAEIVRVILNFGALVHLIASLRMVYAYGSLRTILTGFALIVLFNSVLVAWVVSVGFFAFTAVS